MSRWGTGQVLGEGMTDERIISYLLEELPEADLERFEYECFERNSWPELAEEIAVVENDLIDAYLRNELPPQRRQHFERNYLTTEARQRRFSIAAALLRHCEEQNPAATINSAVPAEATWSQRLRAFWSSQTSVLQFATAIGLVVVMAGTLWLAVRPSSPQTFAALSLTVSNINRAEGAQAGKVRLPLNADALKISLMLQRQTVLAARYRVELDNRSGNVRSVEVAGSDAESVVVIIPAAQLERGGYALKLFLIDADNTERRINGSYFFDVE